MPIIIYSGDSEVSVIPGAPPSETPPLPAVTWEDTRAIYLVLRDRGHRDLARAIAALHAPGKPVKQMTPEELDLVWFSLHHVNDTLDTLGPLGFEIVPKVEHHRRTDLPPLRDSIREAVQGKLGSALSVTDELVDAVVGALNARRAPAEPAKEVEPEPVEVDSTPRAAPVDIKRGPITRISGMTVAQAIMEHYFFDAIFTFDRASEWVAAHGYNPMSASSSLSLLAQDGYLEKLGNKKWRFVKPVPADSKPVRFDWSKYDKAA